MNDFYRLPTPDERKSSFRLIQQYSSWTACQFVGVYHKAFVDTVKAAFEDTQAHPPSDEGPLLVASDMAAFLHGYASMEGALARLHQGDKTVFKFIGFGKPAAPYFCEAYRWIKPWSDGFLADLYNARGMDAPIRRHAMFPLIEVALINVGEAWSYIGLAMESRHTDVPASIQVLDVASSNGIDCCVQFAHTTIPAVTDLPEVPVPTEEVLVKTGTPCPCFGIWEPVKAPMTKGFAGLFKQPQVPAGHIFELDGWMNYLHQGSPMPTIAFEGDGPRGEGRPTVWRLLWKDDRYLDGTIPPVEATYQFIEQRNVPTPPAPPPDRSTVPNRASGEAASVSGRWVCFNSANEVLILKKGDLFPYTSEGWTLFWRYADEPMSVV